MEKVILLPDNSSRWFVEDTLVDIASGNGSAVNMHLPVDFETLTQTLVETIDKPELKISTIICPDWSGYEDVDGKWIYDMGTLKDGIPQTAKSVLTYAQILSQRANMHERPLVLHAQIPHWEITRDGFNEKTGLSTQEADQYLRSSMNAVNEQFQKLTNGNFRTEIGLQKMNNFHQRVEKDSNILLANSIAATRSIMKVRRDLHGQNYTEHDAAVEIAESSLGWELLKKQTYPDIILVPTSPTIARACLSGKDQAWIQLKHNYMG